MDIMSQLRVFQLDKDYIQEKDQAVNTGMISFPPFKAKPLITPITGLEEIAISVVLMVDSTQPLVLLNTPLISKIS